MVVNLAGENLSAGHWTVAPKRALLENRLNARQTVVKAISTARRKSRGVQHRCLQELGFQFQFTSAKAALADLPGKNDLPSLI